VQKAFKLLFVHTLKIPHDFAIEEYVEEISKTLIAWIARYLHLK